MDNPYQTPETLNVAASAPTERPVSPEVIRAMGGTKGWVRFLGVLGFVTTALMVVAAIGILFLSQKSGMGGLFVGMGLGYLFFAALNFYAAFKLNQYASKIGALLMRPFEVNLVEALEAQRGFWKYVGVMAIVVIAFYLLAIFAGMMNR